MPKPQAPVREEKTSGSGSFRIKQLFKWDREVQWSVLFWVTVVLITYLLIPFRQSSNADYQPGDIAKSDIKASKSILVEDEASTQARRLEAKASVLAVYDFDRKQDLETISKIKFFFQKMRNLLMDQQNDEKELISRYRNAPKESRPQIQEELDLFRKQAEKARAEPVREFIESMSIGVSLEQMAPLLKDGFSEKSQMILVESFQPILGMGIVSNRELLLKERGRGVAVRTLDAVTQEMVLDDFSGILSQKAARARVKKVFSSVKWSRHELRLKQLLEVLAQDLVRPNFTFNRSETEARRIKAVTETKPVYLQVKRGEVIVRAGDPLTDEKIVKIRALSHSGPSDGRVTLILGLFILVAIVLFTFFRILFRVDRKVATDTQSLVILVVIIAFQVVLTKGSLAFVQTLATTYTGLTLATLTLVVPFSAGAMIAATLFPVRVGFIVAGLTSIFSALLTEWSLMTFLYSFIGGVVASFSVIHCRQRSSLVKAGLAVGGVSALLALVNVLKSSELFTIGTLWQLPFAVGGGIVASLIVSLALPIMESGFRVGTDMKLMELANLNQPILKKMILRAPGSYHHSVLVGSLAEAAAEEIGANPLLTKVAALYHDVGKINKPEYFVENQEGRGNRHEKLSPNMSALILTAHVKDGVEVAREQHLPRRMVDIIKQHHGTRLITFFFNKAKDMEDPSVQTVDERDFRYFGPKPQSREAALIMLADAVEAASKVLTDPTPARIRGLVQKIINDIFIDGQLDESDLTLKDLHQIAKSFTRTITGIFHHRIDYPDLRATAEERDDKKGRKTIGSDREQNHRVETVHEDVGDPGLQNIKRPGQS